MYQGLPWTQEARNTLGTALDSAQEGLVVEIICQIIKGLVGLSVLPLDIHISAAFVP